MKYPQLVIVSNTGNDKSVEKFVGEISSIEFIDKFIQI